MLIRLERELRAEGEELRADQIRRIRGILAYVEDLVEREAVADWRDKTLHRLRYVRGREEERNG